MAGYQQGTRSHRDAGDREQPVKRSVSSTVRSGVPARSSVRQTTRASSTTRYNPSASLSSSRLGQHRATSPAESVASLATNATKKRKDRDFEHDADVEQTNINVVVRCRGRNEREVREDSNVVVKTDGVRGNLVEMRMGPNALSNKSYHFDRVFSPAADQGMVFDDVVRPILDDMLAGYNCTIFAYGQTGTGKTYTMSGDMTNTYGMLSDAAGIIPRVLQGLFNKIEENDAENCVKVSFVELYNEELRDLISVEETNKLKIFDDKSKRGHTTTVVQGLEEKHVQNAAEGIEVLQAGSHKRQVAATKCNDLSSRSHSVFTITAYTRRDSADGPEEYVQAGKLNLVDLAGSENIQRSGAENKRAAEAGLINKSLLTLGRVINALVDGNAHIPYRESKLTRLLQDSLGGRTKTCIIATVSPAQANLEETISTLDYAFRAKNIQNKPQTNQPTNKKFFIKELTTEIERLKTELTCHRLRNGVYLANDAYEDLTAKNESRRVVVEEQTAKIETLESNLKNKTQELFNLTTAFMDLKKDHEGTKSQLERTKGTLDQTEFDLSTTRRVLNEEKHVQKAHQKTEEELAELGYGLIASLEQAVDDLAGLRAKDKRRSNLHALNRSTWGTKRSEVSDVTSLVEDRIRELRDTQTQQISSISERMQSFVSEELSKLSTSQSFLVEQLSHFGDSKQDLLDQGKRSKDDMDEVLGEIKDIRDAVKERVGESLRTTSAAAEKIAGDVQSEIEVFHGQLTTSYGALDADFKSMFGSLSGHLAAQRQESERLKHELESAAKAMMAQNETLSARVRRAIEEEREQATKDRQHLMAQITSLVMAQTEARETRLAEKTAFIQTGLQDSNVTLEGNVARYGDAVNAWDQKGEQVRKDCEKSKEDLDLKLQNDRAATDKHSQSIQKTAKSIHSETVRIIDEQVHNLDDQMQALNDFVARARSENARHHDTNATAVEAVSSTVENSYSKIAKHFNTTFARVETLGEDMEIDTGKAEENMNTADEMLCEPLADLREEVNETSMREYASTGETPVKHHFELPEHLPRTETRDVLVSGMRDVHSSPSKSTTASFAVFSDLPEYEESTVRSPPRLSAPTAVQDRNPLGTMSLWEVNPNVAAASTEEVVEPLAKRRRSTRRKTEAVKTQGRENVLPMPTEFSASVGGPRRKSPRLQ